MKSREDYWLFRSEQNSYFSAIVFPCIETLDPTKNETKAMGHAVKGRLRYWNAEASERANLHPGVPKLVDASASTSVHGFDARKWQELEKRFRSIHEQHKNLRADGDYILLSEKPWVWRLAGAGPSAANQFRASAQMAGNLLDSSAVDPFTTWLEELRNRSDHFEWGGLPGIEVNADGTDGANHMSGWIYGVAEASADYCCILESESARKLAATGHAPITRDKGGPVASTPIRFESPNSSTTPSDREVLPETETSAEGKTQDSTRSSLFKVDQTKVRTWMANEGYDVTTLAKALKISDRAVSSLLNDGAYHGNRALTKLANQMKCDVLDLYES